LSIADAVTQLRAGRAQAAASIVRTHLARDPSDARGWFLLGACQHAMNELPAAADAFARSLALDPTSPETHLARISVLRALRDAHRALEAGVEAMQRFPGEARLLYAVALCLEDVGRTDDALDHYDRALRLSPAMEDALHNRGLLLSRLGRYHEAESTQRRYIAAHPSAPRAYAALADTLLALDRYDETLAALDDLERIQPIDASVGVRKGVAMASLRRFAEARQVFAAARARDARAVENYLQQVAAGSEPEVMLSPENIYICRTWRAFERCEWAKWNDVVELMRNVASGDGVAIEPAVAFMSRLTPLTGAERHAIARRVSSRIDAQHPPMPPLRPVRRSCIHIGVLSPDFREHLNAYLLLPLFELLDRERFRLSAYSLLPDDGSSVRKRIRGSASTFRELQGLDDRAAAQIVREDDIDILLDVGGFTTGSRYAITAQRPARLQVNYLGFSSSLASPRVDYAIVDRVCGGDDSEWTEARAHLPDTHFLYDFRSIGPLQTVRRQEYGLPSSAFVFCAFHRGDKITPDVFSLWMQVLAQAPNSILWFRGLPEAAARNLKEQAVRQGVDGERLIFAPFEPRHDPRYLARHALGDLMLDSLHHNAMTSACDALGMGLPVLTLPGRALAARAGESFLRAANLPELIVRSEDDYVRKAVQLATHPALLAEITARLHANRRTAPLFDTAGRVRALEAAFQQMHERMLQGATPASFDVQA
jgi:protein O-GlcNAc transferase